MLWLARVLCMQFPINCFTKANPKGLCFLQGQVAFQKLPNMEITILSKQIGLISHGDSYRGKVITSHTEARPKTHTEARLTLSN